MAKEKDYGLYYKGIAGLAAAGGGLLWLWYRHYYSGTKEEVNPVKPTSSFVPPPASSEASTDLPLPLIPDDHHKEQDSPPRSIHFAPTSVVVSPNVQHNNNYTIIMSANGPAAARQEPSIGLAVQSLQDEFRQFRAESQRENAELKEKLAAAKCEQQEAINALKAQEKAAFNAISTALLKTGFDQASIAATLREKYNAEDGAQVENELQLRAISEQTKLLEAFGPAFKDSVTELLKLQERIEAQGQDAEREEYDGETTMLAGEAAVVDSADL